jgi:hypothetical protein
MAEVREAVVRVGAYQCAAGCSLQEAVDVVCDRMGIPRDRDRRIVRRFVLHGHVSRIRDLAEKAVG